MSSVLGKRLAAGEAKIDFFSAYPPKVDIITDFDHYLWREEFPGLQNVWHYAVAFKGDLVHVQSLFSYIVHSLRFAEKIINFLISKMHPSDDKYLPLDKALQLCLKILESKKIKPSKTGLSISAQITQAKTLVQDFMGSADYLQLQQAPTKARQTFEDGQEINAFMLALQEVGKEAVQKCKQQLHIILDDLETIMGQKLESL